MHDTCNHCLNHLDRPLRIVKPHIIEQNYVAGGKLGARNFSTYASKTCVSIAMLALNSSTKTNFSTGGVFCCSANLARSTGSDCGRSDSLFFETDRATAGRDRSLERRVGKECRYRWSPYH